MATVRKTGKEAAPQKPATTRVVAKKETTAQKPDNNTVYKNAPISGGTVEVISKTIVMRAPVRRELHLDDFMAALKSAEMRLSPNRRALYDLYSAIMLDGHLFGVIQKRLLSVLNQEVFYTDAEGENVDAMQPFIENSDFYRTCRLILESQFDGVSGIEAIPGPVYRINEIPRKHIDTKEQMIRIDQVGIGDGFDYTRLDNVWIIGEPEDLGLLLQCAPLVIYKRGTLSDWANFIEIFGMPVRVIKYDPTDSTAEKKLKEMTEEDGNMLAVMIPTTANFEILDGKTGNANGDLQGNFIKMLNDEISITVVGNTETTGNSGVGSQAKSKTHSDQQKEIIKADIKFLETNLNDPHFIKILASYGAPIVEGGRFRVRQQNDINRAAQKVIIDTMLVEKGLEVAADYFYNEYDIPNPTPGDKLLKPAQPAAPGNNPQNQQKKDVANLSDSGNQLTESDVMRIMTKGLKDFFD